MSSWQVIQGDCLEVLKSIPAGSVDAVVTDPPYGINFQSAWRTESERFAVIEGDEAPALTWLPPSVVAMRIGAPMVCFCRWDVAEPFREAIGESGLLVRSQLIWDRIVHGLGDLEASFAPRHDTIWFATKGEFRFPGKRPASVLRHMRPDAAKLVHPCEKPIPLLVDLIESTTRPGETILDPFCGSGTTGVACMQTGRNFIGIEIDPGYCEIARRRIGEAANTLWTPEPREVQTGMFEEKKP